MNKKFISYSFLLAIVLACIFFVKTGGGAKIAPPPTISPVSVTTSSATTTKTSSVTNEIPVNFLVGDKNYSLDVPIGSTAYDAMNILASSTDFSFTTQLYPGLGYFIEEINGVKNQNGMYWTLYVNGAYSNVGVSDYKISFGDVIEWKYEK